MSSSKAELARQLKISPAYMTMLCNGKRDVSEKLKKKVKKLGLTNEFTDVTLN